MNDMATWRVQSLLNGDGIFYIDENKLAKDKPKFALQRFTWILMLADMIRNLSKHKYAQL